MPVLLECFADDEFASGGFDQMDGLGFLPAHDGTHYLAVRDARGGSGPTYGYALERH